MSYTSRWGLTDEKRRMIMDRLVEITLTAVERSAVKAARAIVECERLDLQAAQVAINAISVPPQQIATNEEIADGLLAMVERTHEEPIVVPMEKKADVG